MLAPTLGGMARAIPGRSSLVYLEQPSARKTRMKSMTLDVDQNALLQLVKLSTGGALLTGVMDRFFVDAPKRVEEMRQGLLRGDRGLAKRGAHSLKSTAGFLGLRGLVSACKDFEAQSMDASADALQHKLREIEELLVLVDEQLPGEVAQVIGLNTHG